MQGSENQEIVGICKRSIVVKKSCVGMQSCDLWLLWPGSAQEPGTEHCSPRTTIFSMQILILHAMSAYPAG